MSKLDEFQDKMLRWRSENKSLRDIQALLGEYGVTISRTMIHHRLHAWNAPPPQGPGRFVVHAERNAKIYRLYCDGVSVSQLVERFGLKRTLVNVIICNQRKQRA